MEKLKAIGAIGFAAVFLTSLAFNGGDWTIILMAVVTDIAFVGVLWLMISEAIKRDS